MTTIRNVQSQVRRALPILIALVPTASVLAADDASPQRLELVCTEQPMMQVAFGEPGEVSYTQEPPKHAQPFRLTIQKTGPGADFKYDFASIDGEAPDLTTDEAIWVGDDQIEARQGRFKINLQSLVMTLTETGDGGETRFRKFACEEQKTQPD